MNGIPEISPEMVTPLFITAAMLPPDKMSALLSGLMAGMVTAIEGDCECDTCITIRGCAQGMPEIMAGFA
jgi:hypothetical protein